MHQVRDQSKTHEGLLLISLYEAGRNDVYAHTRASLVLPFEHKMLLDYTDGEIYI